MPFPFGKTKTLEGQFDEFLDIIVKGALGMKGALSSYLADDQADFIERIQAVADLERRADDIRRRTETTLYTYSLIPESRGDVLGLLENMDNLIDGAKEVLQSFEVQQPVIPTEFHKEFLGLTDMSVEAVEQVVLAARAYMRKVHQVRHYINKVDHFESEADRAGLKLKRSVFRSDLDLASKMHIRYFAEQIESISDIAEDVGERLSIAAIKRNE